MVVNKDVIRMSDPERTRGQIGVDQGPTAFGLDDKVILQSILSLGRIRVTIEPRCVITSYVPSIIIGTED